MISASRAYNNNYIPLKFNTQIAANWHGTSVYLNGARTGTGTGAKAEQIMKLPTVCMSMIMCVSVDVCVFVFVVFLCCLVRNCCNNDERGAYRTSSSVHCCLQPPTFTHSHTHTETHTKSRETQQTADHQMQHTKTYSDRDINKPEVCVARERDGRTWSERDRNRRRREREREQRQETVY